MYYHMRKTSVIIRGLSKPSMKVIPPSDINVEIAPVHSYCDSTPALSRVTAVFENSPCETLEKVNVTHDPTLFKCCLLRRQSFHPLFTRSTWPRVFLSSQMRKRSTLSTSIGTQYSHDFGPCHNLLLQLLSVALPNDTASGRPSSSTTAPLSATSTLRLWHTLGSVRVR